MEAGASKYCTIPLVIMRPYNASLEIPHYYIRPNTDNMMDSAHCTLQRCSVVLVSVTVRQTASVCPLLENLHFTSICNDPLQKAQT